MDGTTHAGTKQPSGAADAPVPVLWLIGKAQAGKTSIAVRLTGAGEEGIGFGFKRVTTEPLLHAWPPPPMPPVLRFLDTPGIGAPGADNLAEARTAMDQAEEQAHVLLVAVRAEDLDLDGLLAALREIRVRHPEWPLIVAQTRLHDLYPHSAQHTQPYPFHGDERDLVLAGVPSDLRAALGMQRKAFGRLPGLPPVFVPIDFTRRAQGLEPVDYGAGPLLNAIGAYLPSVVAALQTMADPLRGARLRVILPYALAAGASEAPPLPFVGLLGATTFQGLMLRAIAARCGLRWSKRLAWRFVAVLGPGIAVSFGGAALVRQLLKMAPGPGTAAAAMTAFAATWAAGEAAMVFFSSLGRGEEPDPEKVREAWMRGFEEARQWWNSNRKGDDGHRSGVS